MGLGVSGLAAVRYLLAAGVRPLVSEAREAKQLPAADWQFLVQHGVEFEGGGHSLEFLRRGEQVLVSPGIPLDLPVLREVRSLGIPTVGELALAAPLLDKPVVAVTGTNGKTTVTALIGDLLRAAGKKVFVGGNIGASIFSYLLNPEGAEILVLELSSFQLEAVGDFKAAVALLLNVTPDHLDRHGTMAGYARAKMNIFAGQGPGDTAILGLDDPACQELAGGLPSGATHLFFGHGEECQARIVDHGVSLLWSGKLEHYPLTGTLLDSFTGALNSGAAILAARTMGCSPEAVARGLQSFQVAAHRMALVAEQNGVAYYNDSKATNTGAALSALANFAGNVILIAGGRDKGDDYRLLRESVAQKVRHLILIGEAQELIAAAVAGATEVRRASSLEEAVALAAGLARSGDTVLLSPACASFDSFDNYGHRGRVFAAAVHTTLAALGPAEAKAVPV